MCKQILLVEDDPSISDMVENYLLKEGFSVTHAGDGLQADTYFSEKSFDLILLDLMLPGRSGMDFLKGLREQSTIPVLIISAKDSDVDKALGLGFGADDYIAKPFSMIELTARIHSAIRRVNDYSETKPVKQKHIIVHDITLDLDNRRLYKRDQEIKLTSKEWEILKLFFLNQKKVFTKEHIYCSVWRDEYYGDENIINVHMRRLREKIEDDPSTPKYIETLWGIGYRLGMF